MDALTGFEKIGLAVSLVLAIGFLLALAYTVGGMLWRYFTKDDEAQEWQPDERIIVVGAELSDADQIAFVEPDSHLPAFETGELYVDSLENGYPTPVAVIQEKKRPRKPATKKPAKKAAKKPAKKAVK